MQALIDYLVKSPRTIKIVMASFLLSFGPIVLFIYRYKPELVTQFYPLLVLVPAIAGSAYIFQIMPAILWAYAYISPMRSETSSNPKNDTDAAIVTILLAITLPVAVMGYIIFAITTFIQASLHTVMVYAAAGQLLTMLLVGLSAALKIRTRRQRKPLRRQNRLQGPAQRTASVKR